MADFEDKAAGTFKIATGVYLVCSGTLTALGMGLLGTFLRNQHMMGQAGRIAQIEFKEAEEAFKEGVRRWKKDS